MSKERKKLSEEEIKKIAKAKEELREYRKDIGYLKDLGYDLVELRECITSTTSKLSHSKTGNPSSENDKFSDKLNRIDEIEKDRSEKLEILLTKKFVIDEKIDSMKYPHRDILFKRYSRLKNWDTIANELGYSLRRVHQLHSEALLIYACL